MYTSFFAQQHLVSSINPLIISRPHPRIKLRLLRWERSCLLLSQPFLADSCLPSSTNQPVVNSVTLSSIPSVQRFNTSAQCSAFVAALLCARHVLRFVSCTFLFGAKLCRRCINGRKPMVNMLGKQCRQPHERISRVLLVLECAQ